MERIICGDNLEVLRTIESESVDLCYIDPPFFSGRNYAVVFGDEEEVRQFGDRWVKMNENGKYTKDINVYLNWMEPRLREIHRVLKKTGSFYLHCDWHASHYLKILCDQIFGYNRFLNEIVWDYSGGGVPKNRFAAKHDIILFYCKTSSKDRVFNIQYKPYSETTTKHTDGSPLNEKGTPMTTAWSDLRGMSLVSKERLGYPTQKPEKLLERIIQASSNEGDVVLDAFCGCGTTLAVAKRLNRQFIGIDVSPTACRLMADRIKISHECIEGMALTVEEIGELSGWEFQNWIIREFGAINGKKGADGGIDGDYEGYPIQVKKYRVGRNDLDAFSGAMLRNNKKTGIFIGISFASTFVKEVSRLERDNDIKIYYYSAADILAGKHKRPMAELRLCSV